jgi:hypothetical protein
MGSANLPELPYRNRPSIVLKNSAKATETDIFIKTFGFFNAYLSDSAKRTVTSNLIVSCIKIVLLALLVKTARPLLTLIFGCF